MAEYLVTAEWLQAALADNNNRSVKLVEATFFLPTMNRDALAEFEEAHLPDAVFFDIDAVSQADNPLPHMLPTSSNLLPRSVRWALKTQTISLFMIAAAFFSCAGMVDVQIFWTYRSINSGWWL